MILFIYPHVIKDLANSEQVTDTDRFKKTFEKGKKLILLIKKFNFNLTDN